MPTSLKKRNNHPDAETIFWWIQCILLHQYKNINPWKCYYSEQYQFEILKVPYY